MTFRLIYTHFTSFCSSCRRKASIKFVEVPVPKTQNVSLFLCSVLQPLKLMWGKPERWTYAAFHTVYLPYVALIKTILKHLKASAFSSLAPDLLRPLMQMESIAIFQLEYLRHKQSPTWCSKALKTTDDGRKLQLFQRPADQGLTEV